MIKNRWIGDQSWNKIKCFIAERSLRKTEIWLWPELAQVRLRSEILIDLVKVQIKAEIRNKG